MVGFNVNKLHCFCVHSMSPERPVDTAQSAPCTFHIAKCELEPSVERLYEFLDKLYTSILCLISMHYSCVGESVNTNYES